MGPTWQWQVLCYDISLDYEDNFVNPFGKVNESGQFDQDNQKEGNETVSNVSLHVQQAMDHPLRHHRHRHFHSPDRYDDTTLTFKEEWQIEKKRKKKRWKEEERVFFSLHLHHKVVAGG